MRQAPNSEYLLCKSEFMPVEENFHVTFCGIAFAAHIY